VVTPPVQPKPQPKPKAKPKTAVKAVQKTSTPVQQTPVVVRRVQAVTTATPVATPQGAIQAGAGGTAPQAASRSPLPLLVAGLLLVAIGLGGISRLTHLRSRR
jgi:outer membrane biosynthesis protein TonB